jgi:hypothetical protein
MTTRLKTASLLLGAVTVSLCFYLSAYFKHNPVYAGKRLSEWLNECSATVVPFDDDSSPTGSAVEALRTIGTNATPMLLELAATRGNSAWYPVQKILGFSTIDSRDKKRQLAISGFQALGSIAENCLPELIKLTADKNPKVRETATVCIAYVGPNRLNAIEALIHRVREDQDRAIRSTALRSVGKLHSNPDLVLPLLMTILNDRTRSLHTPDYGLTVDALVVLHKFGKSARPAMPLVTLLAKDSTWNVSYWAKRDLAYFQTNRE